MCISIEKRFCIFINLRYFHFSERYLQTLEDRSQGNAEAPGLREGDATNFPYRSRLALDESRRAARDTAYIPR